MSNEIQILKLMDGSTIVGKVTVSGEIVEVEHPIELVSSIIPMQGNFGETMNLRPWVAISEETTFTIDRINVITMSTLQKEFATGYEKMVDQIYFNERPWQYLEDMSTEELEEKLDIDAETIAELADAMLKNKIH